MSTPTVITSPLSLVTQAAPDFTANAVLPSNEIDGKFNLKTYLAGSYGLVFFYPLDFTFVCPSEILAHDHRLAAFAERAARSSWAFSKRASPRVAWFAVKMPNTRFTQRRSVQQG